MPQQLEIADLKNEKRGKAKKAYVACALEHLYPVA